MRLTLKQIALLHACKFVLRPHGILSSLEQYNLLRTAQGEKYAKYVTEVRKEFDHLFVDQILVVIDELTALFIEFNKNTTDYEAR